MSKRKIERDPQRGTYVIAEGEATGHAHEIDQEIDFYDDGNVKFLSTFEPAVITHEEHKPITLPAKTEFEVGTVLEYNHMEEQARKVRD